MYAIEITDLNKTYPDFTLDNVNLVLPSGCIMGLIGENGAGKSTIIKLILNMIHRDSGKISILGRENQKEMHIVKEDIGVVMDFVGFPECLTAKQVENIMKHTYRNWDKELYYSYLERMSLPLDKELKDFSLGMWMKLGIVVALSHHAKLLILDEATSGLDPVVRDDVLNILNEFTREESHAVLMSSHIVSDLEKICDYITFLHKGKILLSEEKDYLLEEYGVIRCTKEQLCELDETSIKGKKESSYGVEALVKRDKVPAGMDISPVGLEDLFIFFIKEAI